jgi:hypothetical protein
MALPLPPTLQEVRTAVAIRLGYGQQAERAPAMRELIDEFIRRAAVELLLEADWVELRVRVATDLLDGVDEYDFPDRMDPGRIEQLIVVDKDGHEIPMLPGLHASERSLLDSRDSYDLPVRYEFIDGLIKVSPPPDAERYPTLLIEGYQAPAEPHADSDRIPLHKEALIRWATALGKAHFHKLSEENQLVGVRRLLQRVRATQSEGATIHIGGHFSSKFPFVQPRRIGRRGHRGPLPPNYWLY